MTKRIIKVFSTILVVLLLIYFGYQIYMVAYPDYSTEIATISAVEDSISATGIVVRDETVIDSSGGGVRSYLVSNGEKVAKDSNVAELYASAQDALDNMALTIMQDELKLLDEIAGGHRTSGTNIDSITARVYRLLTEISQQTTRDDYSDITAKSLLLLELLNSYAMATGENVNVAARRAELAEKIAEISARDISPTGYIKTSVEGYFISSADGFESRINKTTVFEMPAGDIEALAKGENLAIDTSSCKVVSDYTWYYAAVIDQRYAKKFVNGAKLMLDFNYTQVSALPVTVIDVKIDEDLGKTVVLLECTRLNTSIADIRCESAQLSFRNHSGIIVRRSALRIENGMLGVYVKFGATIEFKEVNIIYESDDYVVSMPDNNDSKRLALYDEIIVQGKDLYVGKNIR